jgi:hypothetical protein
MFTGALKYGEVSFQYTTSVCPTARGYFNKTCLAELNGDVVCILLDRQSNIV